MFITVKEIAGPDDEVVDCGYIELDADGYLVLPNDKVGSLALSFWVKSNTNANIYVSDKSSTSVNDWRRVSFVFVSDGSDVKIKFSPANYYIYKVKLEKGSKITDWSLSPDDVADGINSLSVRMSKAEQLISPEGIISTVKNSEMYQDDINGIKGRLDEAELKITSDAIVSTVKAGIDGSYLASEINQSAGKVLIKANCIELDGETIAKNLISQTIQSSNYIQNTSGMKLSLADGVWDSKNFKVTADGTVTISGAASISGNMYLTNGVNMFFPADASGREYGYLQILKPSTITGSPHVASTSISWVFDHIESDSIMCRTWNGNLTMQNNEYICGENTHGSTLKLIGINNSNNVHLGAYGLTNNVYIHGHSYQINFSGAFFRPNDDNKMALGGSSNRWTAVYAKNGTIQTSDRNRKKDITPITDVYEQLFDSIKPVSYMFKDGDRTHIGAIAQDIEESMTALGLTSLDFGGLCRDQVMEYDYDEEGGEIEGTERPVLDENGQPKYEYSLRYSEFIMLAIDQIQKLKKRVEVLEAKLAIS